MLSLSDPVGPSAGKERVGRGAYSWFIPIFAGGTTEIGKWNDKRKCSSVERHSNKPDYRGNLLFGPNYGVRVVREVD